MKDLRFLTVNLSGKADLKKIKAFKQFNHYIIAGIVA